MEQQQPLAIYPGTFDPMHFGHLDVAERASRMFGGIIVAVYDRPHKNLLFSQEERIRLWRESVAHLPQIQVEGYSGLTVRFARERRASVLVRGLRANSDYEFEYQIATMNRHLAQEVDSIFLMTALNYAYLSSSIIKEVAAQDGDLAGLVPPPVAQALREKYLSTVR